MPEQPLKLGDEVAAALTDGLPVVGLETAVLTHGLPEAVAWSTYRSVLQTVRANRAVPAPVGVLDGTLWVGMDEHDLHVLSRDPRARKLGLPGLPVVSAEGVSGGTTVAATLWACSRAGVRVLATGGIGGVHRGVTDSFDISGDLMALSRYGGCVVCSGAKIVLDLGKTLEMLHTLGVCVLGYRTGELPAFVAADSGLPLEERVEDPQSVAAVVRARDTLGLPGAVLVANPPPAGAAVPRDELEAALDRSLRLAVSEGVRGAAVTPFLLRELGERSAGQSLRANRELLAANAALAARVAEALGPVRGGS